MVIHCYTCSIWYSIYFNLTKINLIWYHPTMLFCKTYNNFLSLYKYWTYCLHLKNRFAQKFSNLYFHGQPVERCVHFWYNWIEDEVVVNVCIILVWNLLIWNKRIASSWFFFVEEFEIYLEKELILLLMK